MSDENKRRERSAKARRADQIFEERVRPSLRADTPLRAYVAIDTASGDFEIEERDKRAAIDRLRERRPEASVWVRRVGSATAHRFGGGRRFHSATTEATG
jgi:hypothetical protein